MCATPVSPSGIPDSRRAPFIRSLYPFSIPILFVYPSVYSSYFLIPFLLVGLIGCTDLSALPSPEPVYEGCASDENWADLDQHAMVDALAPRAGAATWRTPEAGAVLDAAQPAIFRFAAFPGDEAGESGDATCPQYQPRQAGPRHLPPVSGTLCDVRFDRDEEPLARILTTRRVVSLRRQEWRTLGGARLRLRLSCVRLDKNLRSAGPFSAEPREHWVR
jgi:hypothetical protein